MPRCLGTVVELTGLLLKEISGWKGIETFLQKNISWACFIQSGLNFIFHCVPTHICFISHHSDHFLKILTSWTTENRKVPSGSSLHFLLSPADKSFMYIRNKRGPIMEPWGTPEQVSFLEEQSAFIYAFICLMWMRRNCNVIAEESKGVA